MEQIEKLEEIAKDWDCRVELLLSLESTYLYCINKLTPVKWRDLMFRLEEMGYYWSGGKKPTFMKCPSNTLYRNVFIRKDRVLEYGQGSYAPGFNIGIKEFNKLLDLGICIEYKNLDNFTIIDGLLFLKS